MAGAAIVCLACGARNRPEWEYCARCGESLDTVKVDLGDDAAFFEEEAPAEAPPIDESRVILTVALISFTALGFVTCRYVEKNPPPTSTPDPGLFTLATRPAEPTPRAPAVVKPGSAAFDEARRRLAGGDAAGALDLLARAVQEDPGNADYLSLYGQALLKAGDRDGALARLAEAGRIAPQYALEYARTLDQLGRNQEAIAEYERLLATNPDNGTVQEDLGKLLYRTQDYARAAPLLEGAVRARPLDPALRQQLAYALDKAGRSAEAMEAYRQVLATAPDADTTRGLLADSLQRQGKTAEAIALVNEGLQKDPNAPLLHRALGSLYEQSGRMEEAAKEYGEYARLAPNAPDVQQIKQRAAQLVPSAPQ
jgi:Flp pilus assembly protein TadD